MTEYTTKDSGERQHFDSGMQRDTEAGKPRFDLLVPEGVPYEEQLLTRFANLLARGAEKYTERNWEQANSMDEVKRAKSSAFRHFFQWLTGEADEDHAAAVLFNIMVVETIKPRAEQAQEDQTIFSEVADQILGNREELPPAPQPPAAPTQVEIHIQQPWGSADAQIHPALQMRHDHINRVRHENLGGL